MALGAVKGTWTFNAASIVANNQATLATGSAVVARGDLIVVVIGEQTGNTSSGASDTLGNTYTAVTAGTLGGGISGRAFYTVVTNPGTNTNINVAATGSSNNVVLAAASFEGSFTTIDSNPANNNNTDNTSPFSGPATGALAQAVEIVLNWRAQLGNATLTATSPLLKDTQSTSAAVLTAALGHRVVNSTSTSTPEWTGTNPGGSQQGTASFRAASLPLNQYSWPITLAPLFWNDLRTWALGPKVEAVASAAPFAQMDWPVPKGPPYPFPMGGWVQSRPEEAEVADENLQPRAPYYVKRYEIWWPVEGTRSSPPTLLEPVEAEEAPFAQRSWPLTAAPLQPIQTLTVSFNLNLIGQDLLPFRVSEWKVPARQAEVQTWIQSVNLALTQELRPFAQRDWPLTPAPAYGAQLRTWVSRAQLEAVVVGTPFFQSDWPIAPRFPYGNHLRTWTNRAQLPPTEAFPVRQTDWPLPVAAPYGVSLRTWARGPRPITVIDEPRTPHFTRPWERKGFFIEYPRNSTLLNPQPVAPIPFNQYAWVLPTRLPRQPERNWSARYSLTLIGQDRLPPGDALTALAPRGAQPFQVPPNMLWSRRDLGGGVAAPVRIHTTRLGVIRTGSLTVR